MSRELLYLLIVLLGLDLLFIVILPIFKLRSKSISMFEISISRFFTHEETRINYIVGISSVAVILLLLGIVLSAVNIYLFVISIGMFAFLILHLIFPVNKNVLMHDLASYTAFFFFFLFVAAICYILNYFALLTLTSFLLIIFFINCIIKTKSNHGIYIDESLFILILYTIFWFTALKL